MKSRTWIGGVCLAAFFAGGCASSDEGGVTGDDQEVIGDGNGSRGGDENTGTIPEGSRYADDTLLIFKHDDSVGGRVTARDHDFICSFAFEGSVNEEDHGETAPFTATDGYSRYSGVILPVKTDSGMDIIFRFKDGKPEDCDSIYGTGSEIRFLGLDARPFDPGDIRAYAPIQVDRAILVSDDDEESTVELYRGDIVIVDSIDAGGALVEYTDSEGKTTVGTMSSDDLSLPW